jgi:hypothetical protein
VRRALLIYGALNAILYASLTPLWEGFDEAFHYGYVQHLWNARALPIQKRTCLSQEIWQSFPLAPASYIVQRNLPMVTTFDDYFRLSPAERAARRAALERIDAALATVLSDAPNYEAQQAPLAYALLAPFHAIWSHTPLPDRIWRLRLVCALLAALATGLLTLRLARLLGLDLHAQCAALFLVFSSQMFYATTAHVANDSFALSLFLLVLNYMVALQPWLLAAALVAGLLTKAYFLALVPFAIFVVAACRGWRPALGFTAVVSAVAAPWYIRNVVLYRDLAGLQENVGGTSFASIASAILHLPWAKALLADARGSLWEGNSSATSFGSTTIWLMLALLAAGALCYLIAAWRGRPPTPELVLLGALACYAAGLVYNNVIQWVATRGAGLTTAPWYIQLLAPPGYCLLIAGLARSGRPGRYLRIATCALWAYVISATYLAKLIPLYGGYAGRPVRLAEIVRWYTGSSAELQDILRTTALAPPAWIFTLTAAVVVFAVALAWAVNRQTGLRSHK